MPGYQTKQEHIAVRGVDDLVIRSLLDRQQFSDPLGDGRAQGISSAAWPLFGLLWPSGAQLAARIALHPVTRGERILELGCGLALASLVGHRRGADMTASDCHPLAEASCSENLRLNELGADEVPPRPLGAALPHARTRRGRPRCSGRFDLIIGSDLLYERDDDGTLSGFIARHAAPAARCGSSTPTAATAPPSTSR